MCDPANTQSIADYLAQLLKDRKQLAAFPNVFIHVERLLDEGKKSVSVFWVVITTSRFLSKFILLGFDFSSRVLIFSFGFNPSDQKRWFGNM